MAGSARHEREHFAAKIVSSLGNLDLTGYLFHDDIHEDVYQRLYSDAGFRADPGRDRLLGHWPGVAYLNQFYRPGWHGVRGLNQGKMSRKFNRDCTICPSCL